MYEMSLIACIDLNYAIGYKNELLFHIKDDMKHFVNLTKGHTVVMGSKTWNSIPVKNRPLKDRNNIIITTKLYAYKNAENCEFMTYYDFLNKMKEYKLNDNHEKIYIIGGEAIYNLFIDYCNKIKLTVVMTTVDEYDSTLPKITIEKDFDLEDKSDIYYDEENDLYYYFATFIRKPETIKLI